MGAGVGRVAVRVTAVYRLLPGPGTVWSLARHVQFFIPTDATYQVLSTTRVSFVVESVLLPDSARYFHPSTTGPASSTESTSPEDVRSD